LEFEYERLVKAPAEAIWAALTETTIMESHLPGSTRVTSTGPEKLRVSMKISMGFLRPTVNVDIELSDVNPQNSFGFEFQGKALGAGIEGEATVSLGSGDQPESGATRVRMSGVLHTFGLLKKVSDSKIDAAVSGFLNDYFASVERSSSRSHN